MCKNLLQSTTSSMIESFGYDYDTNTMYVRFKSNPKPIYVYPKVPLEVFSDFAVAQSKGSYFVKNIRNNYNYYILA